MKKRKAENEIVLYWKGDSIVEDYPKVVDHFLQYFCNFMGKKSLATRRIDEERLGFIGWQAINNQLLTREHINRIMSIPDDLCPICIVDKETHAHIFMDCPYTLKVVSEVSNWLGRLDWPKSFKDWYDWLSKPLKNL
ncbi:hypothetical protein G4B88_003125 [Cannabis sativa]|uniref:Reverse transcriptase zinc-binding domain-containing protein n=1 Tax=Cannabis sativa TaxID=3483 RepID=A0A7J6H255_CANSA|nr:hypothetical protein G4B88_003125 [Cannabis sativa]